MSELSKARLATDFVPTDDRYADSFGELPLQATLNMLDAHKPVGNGQAARDTRLSMERVREELLVSSQASGGEVVDLTGLEDEVLQKASDHLWEKASAKTIARYRNFGGKVVPIAQSQST